MTSPPPDWSDFYLATAGASAGLAGLLIVAMSVNIHMILQVPSMVSRAASMIAALILVLLTSCAGLIPGQPRIAFAIETLVAAAPVLILGLRSTRYILASRESPAYGPAVAKALLGVLPTALMLAGAALMFTTAPIAFLALAIGILLTFAASTANAWVLLVEILR